MRAVLIGSIVLIIFAFALSGLLYNQLPDNMASHWNAQGEADGYMDKTTVLLLLPVLCVIIFALMLFMPKFDPIRKNAEGFRTTYENFIAVIVAFFVYLHIIIIAWGIGYQFNRIQALMPAFAAIFFDAGILIKNARRNWFIGIRTPWTMSSDRVWEKTHKRGGKLFMACGLIMLLGIIIPDYAIYLLLVPLMLTVIYTFAYSYFEYKKGK